MTSAVHEVYGLMLASSGKLKLRAKSVLADDDDDAAFRASVLLHEAARIQRRANEALPECPPITRLASAVEECWCLVEGLDPPRAADAWGDVLRARQWVDAPAADALLSRLAPRYEALHSAFVRTLQESQTLRTLRDTRTMAGLGGEARAKARKELTALLAKFPGATSLWWMNYRLAEADGDKMGAWSALGRARELAPENPRFLAMSLLVAAWALPLGDVEKHLAGVRGSLERAEAEICLMYALAEITLARKTVVRSVQQERWISARHAANAGVARATSPRLRKNLRATQLLLDALLDGREPTLEILYVAGLSELASIAKANADVVDLLTTRGRQAA